MEGGKGNLAVITVTLNPAVDEKYRVKELKHRGWTRAVEVDRSAGGKGINVSRILKQLGHDSIVMGFIGGFTGELVRVEMEKLEITSALCYIKGDTRIDTFITDLTGELQVGITEEGPVIRPQELRRFKRSYGRMLNRADFVYMGGSLPKGVPDDIYAELISEAKDRGKMTFLEAAGTPLLKGIEASPDFVKIDHRYVSEIYGHSIKELNDIIKAVREIEKKGNIKYIVIDYHESGDVFRTPEGYFLVELTEYKPVKILGGGDALVAAFIASLIEGMSLEESIIFSMATAYEELLHLEEGIRSREHVERLKPLVKLRRLE